jgi:hypothetical protein
MMARKVMGALVAGAMGATPAFADVFAANIVAQLQSQGFTSISRERTWLGRTRIVAEGEQGQREIIVNPNNGEILRDLWLVERRNGGGEGMARGNGSGGSVGSTAASAKETDDWGDKAGWNDKTWTDKDWKDNDWGDRRDSKDGKGGSAGQDN